MSPGRTTLISLGSNLGDSVAMIRAAVEQLALLSAEPLVKSSLWQTAPVDCPAGSPPFVNAAVALAPKPKETPESLLVKIQALEKEFGRRPKLVLNEPRPLDLDLIAFGSEVRKTPALTLPHPRAHLRRFVLEPLSEIAPGFLLPGQSRTISELLAALTSDERVVRLSDGL
jgi:2-amino-4-hydroxy-6-hydroxymethyldihydropteridine diphosphokinase